MSRRVLLRDLEPGRTYKVAVRSTANGSTSEWSQMIDVLTTSDTIPPKAPTGLSWTVEGTAFKATWTAPTQSEDNTALLDLKDYQITVFSSAAPATKAIYYTTANRYDFPFESNLAAFGVPRASVTIEIRSRDNTGNISTTPLTATATNAAPTTPANLSAVAITDGISLKWDAVADADLREYRVYYGTTLAGATTLVFTGRGTAYTHANSTYGTDAYYKVVSVDVFGTESVAASVGPYRPNSGFGVDMVAPDVPAGLAATLTNATDGKTAQAVVTWTAVADPSNDLAEYILGYKPSATADWQYTKVDYTNTSTTILGLTPYVNYDFRIRASDFAANLSAWSSTLTKTATANAAPATVTGVAILAGKDGVTVSWTPNSESDVANGAGVYMVDIATNSGFTTGLLSYRTGEASITINGLTAGATYYARVKAVDSLGLASAGWSASASATLGTYAYVPKYTILATAPVGPTTGDMWMDTTSGFEKQWNGSAWVTTGNVSTKYIASRGTDMVTNGSAFMKNNYNFATGFDFNGADPAPGTGGSFYDKTTAVHSATIDELLPYDPSKKYRLSFQMRQTVAGATNRAYGALQPYDIDGLSVSPYTYVYITGTQTTLAADLVAGQTTVQLTSGANWFGSASKPAGSATYQRTIQFWDWVDGAGKAWAPYTYTQHYIANAWADGGVVGNTITLSAPYAGPTVPAGTQVSNGTSGGSYLYMPTLTNGVVPETWTFYKDVITGINNVALATTTTGGYVWGQGMPPATASVKIGWLLNYAPSPANPIVGRHAVAAVSFSDAASAQQTADNALLSASGKNAITFSLSAPVSPDTNGRSDGDTWFQKDGTGTIIGQWEMVAGNWISKTVGNQVIANLDAGKLTAGSAFVTSLNIGAGGSIQSAGYTGGGTTGFQLSNTGLTIKGTGNTIEASVLKGGTIAGTTINIGALGVLNVDSSAIIKSNNYSAGSTGYALTNTLLELNDGTVDAKTLKTGSAIIGDLIIGRSADNVGTIKSWDYGAGAAGWKIGKGLFEINNGLIRAAALQLQSSPNLMAPQFADFEFPRAYYIDPFWSAGGQAGMFTGNCIVEPYTSPTASLYKGKQFLSLGMPFNTSAVTAYFGSSATDYNISVEAGKTYIWSIYMRNPQSNAETWNVRFKGDNGTQFQSTPFALSASEPALVRRSVAVTIPAGVSKILISLEKPNAGFVTALHIDCQQFEEKTGADNTPSVWKPPGATVLDGAGITTGLIRSQTVINVSGTDVPTWSINTQGAAQFGDALVRGKLIVGQAGEALPNRAPNNGDFETDVSGYQLYQSGATGAAFARTTTAGEILSGTGSAKSTAAAGTKTSLGLSFNTPETYLPGTTLRIRGKVKVNTTDAGASVAVSYWNTSLAAMKTQALVASPVANTVYSFDYSYTITAGQNVGTVILYHGPSSTATSVIFDDIVLTADSDIGASFIQSANFVAGSAGWKIDSVGAAEFNSGTFRGSVVIGKPTAISAPTVTMGAQTTYWTGTTGTYYYKITGYNQGGETVGSNEVSKAVTNGGNSPYLSWGALPLGLNGVKIYRGTAAGAENRLVATIAGSAAAGFTDTGAAGTAASPPGASTIANSSQVVNIDSSGLYAGATSYAYAPFTIDLAGNLTAGTGTITGYHFQTGKTGKKISLGATAFDYDGVGNEMVRFDTGISGANAGFIRNYANNDGVGNYGQVDIVVPNISTSPGDLPSFSMRQANPGAINPQSNVVISASSGTLGPISWTNDVSGTPTIGDSRGLIVNGPLVSNAQQYSLTMASGWSYYGATYGGCRAYRGPDGAWVLTGLVSRSGAAISIPTSGVLIGTIPASGYAGTITQMSPSISSSIAGNFAVEVRSGGGIYLRVMTGTAVSFTTSGWFNLSGMTFHEAAN